VITAIIVLGSLALAGVFVAAWWLKPGLRAQIEAPSVRFAAAARSFDRARFAPRQTDRGASDGE
jgi:hypothetical protein